MALFRRNKTWWSDFSINGQRYRQSLRTTDWRKAQAGEKELIIQASQGKLAPSSQQFARLAFSEAAVRYVESRKLELAPRSVQKERELLRAPEHHFCNKPVSRLTAEDLLAYREKRAADGKAAVYINMEMGAIRRILKRAKRWHLVAADIRPLKERRRVGRALAPDEKLRLLRVAASNPDWQVARCAAIVALNTTMRGCGLKGLQWQDVNLLDRTLMVWRGKTTAGERVIPLNADAMAAILELYHRAQAVGGTEPDHYVFPACENGRIDPTRAQKTWRSAWRSLRKAAGLPTLRFHDLRHHAITELAESQASELTIMAIAGHVSHRMLERYSHVRLEAKRRALDALSSRPAEVPTGGGPEGGYGTQSGTIDTPQGMPDPQVLEKDGGRGWIRTTDLTLIRGAL